SGLNEADDVRSRVVGRRPDAPPAVAGVRRRDRPDASGLAHGTALEVVSVRGRRVVLKQAQPRPDGGWRWTLLLGTGLELGLQLELELQLAQHAPRGHTAAEIAVSASLGFEQQELGLRSYEAVDAEVRGPRALEGLDRRRGARPFDAVDRDPRALLIERLLNRTDVAGVLLVSQDQLILCLRIDVPRRWQPELLLKGEDGVAVPRPGLPIHGQLRPDKSVQRSLNPLDVGFGVDFEAATRRLDLVIERATLIAALEIRVNGLEDAFE